MKALRPILQIALRYLVALCLAAVVAVPAAYLMAQSASESTQATLNRASADALDRDAANLRQAADAELRRAQDFQKLADDAAKHARDTDNPVAKEVWTETAGDRQKDADRLKKDAEQLQIQAAAKTAEAQRLRASPTAPAQPQPTPTATPPVPQPPSRPSPSPPVAQTKPIDSGIPVEALLGTWVNPADSSELEIVPIDPADPNRKDGLRLLTRKHRVPGYTGSYLPGVSPRPARLTFSLRPKAPEMNAQIPMWARQAVEGQLAWRFDLDEIDDCVCSGLKGKWYPGEVTWTGNVAGGHASVSGEGRPIEVTYKLKPPDPTAQVKRPVLFVLSNNPAVKEYHPLQSVAFKSPFKLQVLLPPEVAAQQGAELTVELAAEKTFSTAKITLKGERLSSGVWSYTTDPAVTLVPVPMTGNTTWFRAGNGEMVTAVYRTPSGGGSASEVFTIYQNDVYQAIGQNEETLAHLDEMYKLLLEGEAMLNQRPLTGAERKILEQKRKLIRHARTILAHNLPELTAAALGGMYIDLVQSAPDNGDMRKYAGAEQGTRNLYDWGIPYSDWTGPEEVQGIDRAVNNARDQYDRLFVGLARDFGVDTFDGLFLSDINTALIVLAGTDAYGKSYDATARVMAGIQGVTQIALAGIMSHASSKVRDAMMSRAESDREAWRARRAATELAIEASRSESEVRIDFGSPIGTTAATTRGAARKLMRNPRTRRVAGSEPAFHEDLDGLPASAAFDPNPANRLPDRNFQCRGDVCALMSTVHAADAKRRPVPHEERVLLRLAKGFDLFDSGKGIRSDMMPKLARLLGLNYEFEKRMSLAEVALALDHSDAIVGGMYYLDENGKQIRGAGHAIQITAVIRGSSSGQPSYVKYWDPLTGRNIGMPACDFLKIYDPRDVLIIK